MSFPSLIAPRNTCSKQGILYCGRFLLLSPTLIPALTLTLKVNLLTTVLNASPVLPTDVEDGDLDTLEMVRDNPQCVAFGLFMIWFSSITINLGPTFLRCNKIKSIYQNKFILLENINNDFLALQIDYLCFFIE